ncbi:MAG TPA: S-layer homology domain-containing protein [Mobilitalea sp.]|nr:S-layer homology domain-containing protein [Mobilitalea sp.]
MRRTIALLLSMILILSASQLSMSAVHASAATNTAAQVIKALGIIKTDKGDTSKDTNVVTRAQFAQMLVNMSSQKDKVPSVSNVSLFSDVSKKYWASKYIQTAIKQGWMSGYLNGSFKPEKGITLQEAVNGVIKLLGFTNSDFTGNLIGGQMALYKSVGLNKNITKTNASALLNVNDCTNLFYNTLNAKTKDGKVYAQTLGYALNSNGELDYLSYVNTKTQGPVIADDNWKSNIPFPANLAVYYRDGVKCNSYDIEDYDVLYYSESLNTIWAYDNKVTGTVQAIKPDNLAPSAVTVAGKDYTFEGSDVSIAFSSLGDIKVGDAVTLLLGKDGTAVGVVNVDEFNTTITGVVTETGTHLAENSDGDYVSTSYVSFIDAAGHVYQQDYDGSAITFYEGEIARITYKDGKASVSKYSQDSNYFEDKNFNSDATSLGSVKLASNVKILDLSGNNHITISPVRLSNVTIIRNQVAYYELNSRGEISQLILNDVTGDMDKYGILTGVGYQGGKSSFEYLIGSVKGNALPNTLNGYALTIGPMGFTFDGSTMTGSYSLHEITVNAIGKTTVQDKDTKYLLADEYSVYFLVNGEYVATTIDKVSDLSKYNVKAYYDKSDLFGGRVRVIVAESKN